jgi:carbon storage regulator
MLVLTRRVDQAIVIGDEIEIVVVDIKGDKVRLGISAPTSVSVHRKEVYELIQRENIQASKAGREEAEKTRRLLEGKKTKGEEGAE